MLALDTIIADWSRGIDGSVLEEMLLKAEVPSSRIYTIADIYSDPHYKERNMLAEVPHPTLGHTTQIGIVPRLSATPGAIRRTGPEIGADQDEVLASIGYSADDILAFKRRGVVGSGEGNSSE